MHRLSNRLRKRYDISADALQSRNAPIQGEQAEMNSSSFSRLQSATFGMYSFPLSICTSKLVKGFILLARSLILVAKEKALTPSPIVVHPICIIQASQVQSKDSCSLLSQQQQLM